MFTFTGRAFLRALPLAYPAALWGRPVSRQLSKEEDQFLEDLSHRCFRFFWEQADPTTGLVRDRALANSAMPDPRTHASSAATGFGLAGLCIAADRHWISPSDPPQPLLTPLRSYPTK